MIAFPAHDPAADVRSLAERHLSLVERVATGVARRLGREAEEFMAVGWVALTAAAERFDPTRGVPFAAYAAKRIDGAMTDQFRRADAPVRETAYRRGVRAVSFDSPVGDDDGPSVGSMLAGDEDEAGDRAAAVDDLLAELPPVQRRIVRLIDVEGGTVAGAAEALGLRASHVEGLHAQALAQLRRTANMSQTQIKMLFGDPRFADLVRAVCDREPDEARAAAEVRREMESADLLDAFVDAATIAAVRKGRGAAQQARAPGNAGRAAAGGRPSGDAGRAARLAAFGSVGRTIVTSYLADWRLPDGTPLGEATIEKVRKVAATERTLAVLKLEDAEFLRSVGELADDGSAKVSAVTTDRKLEDLFNSARRLVAYQTTDRAPRKPAKAGRR